MRKNTFQTFNFLFATSRFIFHSSNFLQELKCSSVFLTHCFNSIASSDPDYAIRDLYNAIGNKNPPSWTMYFQVMTYEQAENCPFNPFDLTKVSAVVNIETEFKYIIMNQYESNMVISYSAFRNIVFALHYVVLWYIILPCIVSYRIVLYCTVLH